MKNYLVLLLLALVLIFGTACSLVPSDEPTPNINYYHIEGATFSSEKPISYEEGSTEDLILPTLTKEGGYIFRGWYDSDSVGTAVTTITSGTTGTVSLYAYWEIPGISLSNGALVYVPNTAEDTKTSLSIPSYYLGEEVTSVVRVVSEVLETVTIPSTVVSMGNEAFMGNTSLATVTGGSGVTTLGMRAFKNCTALATIPEFPALTTLSSQVFSGCSSLTTITIPDGIETLNMIAFKNCTSLHTVLFSGTPTLTFIACNVFEGCSALTTITLPTTLDNISGSVFNGCSALTTIVLPDSLTILNSNALANTGLTTIFIPDSVTTMGANIFLGCTSLTTIDCEASAIPGTWHADWDTGIGATPAINWGASRL
mgnify:CR=1 FL=1